MWPGEWARDPIPPRAGLSKFPSCGAKAFTKRHSEKQSCGLKDLSGSCQEYNYKEYLLVITMAHSIKITHSILSSVAQSCPTLCDPMNHSTPGLPVHHQLPGFTQTHVHQVHDAIQPSHPLSSPSPPAPSPSQHQSLFQ